MDRVTARALGNVYPAVHAVPRILMFTQCSRCYWHSLHRRTFHEIYQCIIIFASMPGRIASARKLNFSSRARGWSSAHISQFDFSFFCQKSQTVLANQEHVRCINLRKYTLPHPICLCVCRLKTHTSVGTRTLPPTFPFCPHVQFERLVALHS